MRYIFLFFFSELRENYLKIKNGRQNPFSAQFLPSMSSYIAPYHDGHEPYTIRKTVSTDDGV